MKSDDVFYLAPDAELPIQPVEAMVSRETPDENFSVDAELAVAAGQNTQSNASLGESLVTSLNNLADLIANFTEAYTAAIYVVDGNERSLAVGGVHTLSRDFDFNCRIGFGQGLIGWAADNSKRISVSPFQHDASTLLCYKRDQTLKSFVAVPVLSASGSLIGVISCDSKKSYAFAKITEKLLLDCANQAATLIALHDQMRSRRSDTVFVQSQIDGILEKLRSCDTEEQLLSSVARIPNDLVDRDALVVVSTAQGGVGKGVFYSTSTQSNIEHRLLELVCKHKKVICAERSVHALPTSSNDQRSFLSIPFHTMGREAGSLNLLSRPREAFAASHIEILERIAQTISRELERIRLRDRFTGSVETTGILSWNSFAIRAQVLLADAKENRVSMSLVRLALTNLAEIEDLAGVELSLSVLQKLMRLVEQVKRGSAIACYLYGSQVLLLSETSDAERSVSRLRALLERLTLEDLAPGRSQLLPRLGTTIAGGLHSTQAIYQEDGETLGELTACTAKQLELQSQHSSREVRANVGNWA